MRKDILEKLAVAQREGIALVRAVDPANGEERIVDPASDSSALGHAAAEALARDASGPVSVEGRDWFLTVYNVPQELVIIGAVHIAQALAALALAAGYRVRVIDPRPAYAAEERFAGVRLIRQWPEDALAAEPLTVRSALVALAHDPKIDDPALAAAMRSPAFYIGALGSHRTHGRRLARLAKQGFLEREMAGIHGPVGLPIGARSPSEIAIAILAELVQVRRGGSRIAGLVLAAGLSRRMGSNKLVAQVNGKALVRHAAEAALAGGLDPVIVVTGHQATEVEKALAGLAVTLVHNPDFANGLSTSLRRGIERLPSDCAGAMILLGDMPEVGAELVAKVRAAFDPAKGRNICVATARGERGHPVLWARKFFPQLIQLTGDAGARGLMVSATQDVAEVEAGNASPLRDIDTPAELDAFLAAR